MLSNQPSSTTTSDAAVTRPLCIDMDGTLLATDSLHEQIVWFLTHRFWRCWLLPLWLLKGRACLKHHLARETSLRMDLFPACAAFLEFLRRERSRGRSLILVTAADERTASAVAEHYGIFDQVLASDGRQNFKGPAKLK